MAKKKVLTTTTRGIARITANMDGKYKGLNQKQMEKAMKLVRALAAACIVGGYRSLTEVIRKGAVRDAKILKKKMKQGK